MRVLLPPSETKKPGGGKSFFDPEKLSFQELSATRKLVREALEEVSADTESAKKLLGVGERASKEITHNLSLQTSPATPAIQRYTGVLFDALDYAGLLATAKEWVESQVYIQSALFGLIGAADPIPNYRLSAGSRLPSLAKPLKNTWVAAHRQLPPYSGLTVDMRSKSYSALAPMAGAYVLEVVTPSGDGQVRALNHFNKAAKGDFVRLLAETDAQFTDVAQLIDWGKDVGLQLFVKDETLTLTTTLGAPVRA